MSELNFAKSFLTTLDARNTKYSADHVFDPKTFPTRIPFTLPKLPHPPHPLPPLTKPTTPAAPGSTSATPTATILLKSTRNPALSLTLPHLALPDTTITQLRESVQVALGGNPPVPLDKIKILYNKKPVPPSKKTIADAVDVKTSGGDIEFGVMVMGGAPDPPPQSPSGAASTTTAATTAVAELPDTTPPPPAEADSVDESATKTATSSSASAVAQCPSGQEVLSQPAFWDDLQGFLEQRLKDEGEASRLRKLFEGAWKAG